MGFLNKLAFWKKKDEFDFDALADREMKGGLGKHDLGLEPKPLPGLEEKPMFPEPTAQPHPANAAFATPPAPAPEPARAAYSPTARTPAAAPSKDMELINSKLDTLKALLNSVDQRLANVERAAGVEKKQRLW